MCTGYEIAKAIVDAVRLGLEVKESIETKKEGKHQTQLMREQARQKEQEAAYERQEGVEEARRQRLQSILRMGEEKTSIASGNVSLSSATALNIVEDEKLNGELDALITLKDSEQRAKNYIAQSQQYYKNAALNSYKTKNQFFNSVSKSTLNFVGKSINRMEKANKKGG